MIGKPAFYYVHQLVVAVRVGWPQKEARIDQITNGIADDAFHNFAIDEFEPYPNAGNHRNAGVKIQRIVVRVPIETGHIKDGLDIRC